MKKTLAIICCLLALTACQPVPPAAYANRGQPEDLLVASTDVVTIDLADKDAMRQLLATLKKAIPTKAILNCTDGDDTCLEAKILLDKKDVPTVASGNGKNLTLIYQRVVARDCPNRCIDNSSNVYNLNHSAYGCSMASNIARMVTDKRQFTDPTLLDYTDGDKAAANYDAYKNPPASSSQSGGAAGGISSSLVNSAGSQ